MRQNTHFRDYGRFLLAHVNLREITETFQVSEVYNILDNPMDKQKIALNRSVVEILPSKEKLESLMSSKKIRVYLGVDPTGANLHLGHTIVLKKLQEFADLGHEAILLIGTGTVLAGDPSQRKEARQKIAKEEIKRNIETWHNQASKIIDFNKVKTMQNADWLLRLKLEEILEIASHISATQLIKREMFQERIKKGDIVSVKEMLYPLLQGYDSVQLDADLEIGGTDQTFNMLIGRELQKKLKNREKLVLTTQLIVGLDGKQMSKTSGNCIWLDDSPQEMFGKIMSLADSIINSYWENLTDLEPGLLKKLRPQEAKKMLATEIVKMYHSQKAAQISKTDFENTFQKGNLPKNLDEVTVEEGTIIEAFVTDVIGSHSQAKRLLAQNAVEIEGEVVKDPKTILLANNVVKIGKKKFLKVII